MHGLRAIQTQPDQEVLFAEEVAPGHIQEDAVGLHRMLDRNAWTSVLFDVVHRALEEVQPHQGRFATLPGNRHFWGTLRFKRLADVGFEGLIAHTKAAVGVELLLRQEKAIGAIEVAGGARRFGQDMKGGWCVLWPRSR